MNDEGDGIAELLGGLRRSGDRPAWTFYRGRSRVARLGGDEVAESVERLAGYLVGALGVGAGDRVAVLSGNRVELPALLLAVMRAGAVAVPLNPRAPREDWSTILDHSGARWLFADEAAAVAAPPGVEVLPLDGLLDRRGPAAAGGRAGASAAGVVLYTSGTTGAPKGVALGVPGLVANARRMAGLFGLERTTQLAVLPLFHAHAFGFGLMTALATGGHLVVADAFDPFSWAQLIRAEGVRVTSLVPTLLSPLLAVGVERADVPGLERLLVSSAPLDVGTARLFEEAVGVPLVHGWGLSEYTNFACCLPPDLDDDTRRALLYGDETASVGCPLEGTEVVVVGADGARRGEGEAGELCVRGECTMLGYLHDPDATARTIDADGWLHTGDQGHVRVVGGRPFFFVTGRIKEIIIRGAEKVSPLAVERRLLRDVPELGGKLVVVGFPHAEHGEEVGAYVEMATVPEDLRRRLLDALAGMVVETRPKVVLFGPSGIPRTPTGKVQRRRLESLFAGYRSCRGRVVLAATAADDPPG